MSDFRLRVFSCVAKNLSFTKASQELFISQPAITKHIQELETMYQTRLFERMGNKISLTDAGRLDEITLEEFKKIPLVLRERGSGTLDILLAALQKHNIKLSDLNVKMYLGSTESIKLFLENCDCLGILSIRSVNKELYAGEMKVLEIKDLSMFREFDFVQLQGQENGLPALFMQFAEHYKEKL